MGPDFNFRIDIPNFDQDRMRRLMQAWGEYQDSGGTDDFAAFAARWNAENPFTPGQGGGGSGGGGTYVPPSDPSQVEMLPVNYFGQAPTGDSGQYTASDILVTASEQPNMYDVYDPYSFTPAQNPYDNVSINLPYRYIPPPSYIDPGLDQNPYTGSPDPDPNRLLNSFLDQLQAGEYVYGSVGDAYERGDLTRNQMLQFRAALDDFTGTTIGNRPYEIGEVVGGIGLLPEPEPEPDPKTDREPPQAGGPGRRPTDDEIEEMQHPSNLGVFSLGGKVDASIGSGEGIESFLLKYRDPRTVEQDRRRAAFKRNMQAAMQPQMPQPAAPGPRPMPQGTMQQGIMPIASQRRYG